MRRAIGGFTFPAVVFAGMVLGWATLAAPAAGQRSGSTRSSPSAAEEPLKSDASLRDVCFVDRQRGWIVGQRGTILHTTDGGATWALQRSGVEADLHGVTFIDERTGWVVGGMLDAAVVGGRGVVLHTQDGGRSWRQLDALAPSLRRVQFFDAQRGIAVGCGSDSAPTGVLSTLDGGRSWNPRGGGPRQNSFAADFADFSQGVVGGAAGRAARVIAGELRDFNAVDAAGRTVRDALLTGSQGGWLIGEGGLAYRTRDHGQTWQTVGSLPATDLGDADLRTIAAVDEHLWIAGAPGAYVLHSADGGASWRRQSTGVRTPIHRIRFVDAEHGWAVGDLGVVLATVDGGETWQVQRGENRRTAVLAVAPTAAEVPVETLALLALDEGYRAAALVLTDPGVDPRRPTVDLVARLEDAASSLAVSSAAAAWQFPAPSQRLNLGVDDSWIQIQELNDGRAAQRMTARLVRAIRMWRPDVLIVPAPEADEDRPLSAIVGQAALAATAAASDPTQNIELASQWNLSPWKVKRVFAALPAGQRGTHHLVVGETGRRLNRPLVDLAAAARTVLRMPRLEIGAAAEFQLLMGDGAERPDDLMAGLAIAPGSPARRAWIPTAVGEDGIARQKLLEKRRNLRRLIETGAASPAWLGQIASLIADLESEQAASILLELSQELREQGRIGLAADMMHLLVQRYPDHRRCDEALLWLIQFYASGETAQAYAADSENLWRAETPSDESPVRLAEGGEDAGGQVRLAGAGFSASLSEAERLTRAAQLAEYVSHTHPQLYAENSLRFPWAAAQRKRGFPGSAERYLLTVQRGGEGDPWQACAATEAWLREPDEEPPVKPIVTCRTASQRPHLDGLLEEAVWQSSAPVRLRNADARAKLGAVEMRFAYDAEFLYVSASCAKVPQIQYADDQRPRPYDGDVQSHDHLRILLDLDRDYSTWFELAVDYRGWTADRCWGDAAWNPRWFVAAEQDDEQWRIEAAIPWSQLTSDPPRERHVWAVAVERVAPPVGMQSWNGDAADEPLPEDFGLMIFQ